MSVPSCCLELPGSRCNRRGSCPPSASSSNLVPPKSPDHCRTQAHAWPCPVRRAVYQELHSSSNSRRPKQNSVHSWSTRPSLVSHTPSSFPFFFDFLFVSPGFWILCFLLPSALFNHSFPRIQRAGSRPFINLRSFPHRAIRL